MKWAFATQPNFQVHLILSIIAVILGFILQISRAEFAIIALTIVFGLGIEMANTSIEELTDLVTKEWREEAKIAKDVAAGMMLTVALGALIVACLIFLPKIWSLF